MAHRKYKPRNWSFEYDFDRNGGANGFLPLDNAIPVGWTFLSGTIVVLTAITSAGGAAVLTLSTATNLLSNGILENVLILDSQARFSMDGNIPGLLRNLVQEPLGINIVNGPLLTGRFVAFGQYAIITTG